MDELMEYLQLPATAAPPPPPPQPSRYQRTVLVGERAHFINNSRCKFVSVGLSPYLDFEPALVIGGSRVPDILLLKTDWQRVREGENIIQNYLRNDTRTDKPLIAGNITIYFGGWAQQRVIKLEDLSEQYVTLGADSVAGLFAKEPLIAARLVELEQNRFGEFYARVLKCVKDLSGDDHRAHINNVLRELHDDENVRIMREVLDRLYPRIVNDIRKWNN